MRVGSRVGGRMRWISGGKERYRGEEEVEKDRSVNRESLYT